MVRSICVLSSLVPAGAEWLFWSDLILPVVFDGYNPCPAQVLGLFPGSEGTALLSSVACLVNNSILAMFAMAYNNVSNNCI